MLVRMRLHKSAAKIIVHSFGCVRESERRCDGVSVCAGMHVCRGAHASVWAYAVRECVRKCIGSASERWRWRLAGTALSTFADNHTSFVCAFEFVFQLFVFVLVFNLDQQSQFQCAFSRTIKFLFEIITHDDVHVDVAVWCTVHLATERVQCVNCLPIFKWRSNKFPCSDRAYIVSFVASHTRSRSLSTRARARAPKRNHFTHVWIQM